VKNLFRLRKVRYCGIRKNAAQLGLLFALANLVIARKCLLGTAGKQSGVQSPQTPLKTPASAAQLPITSRYTHLRGRATVNTATNPPP
jgi:hypothetical protein